eukprot:TRINITY_DN30133_c0_g1_i1.p1 TRINITY_DN30133_c0_g1~~TRINITY_DN30133_c0_g1_i1.p1  ORF type:complete len:425 (+),score=104.61 TRINITY_DN30133_c0_g1_i1:28-1302(+)
MFEAGRAVATAVNQQVQEITVDPSTYKGDPRENNNSNDKPPEYRAPPSPVSRKCSYSWRLFFVELVSELVPPIVDTATTAIQIVFSWNTLVPGRPFLVLMGFFTFTSLVTKVLQILKKRMPQQFVNLNVLIVSGLGYFSLAWNFVCFANLLSIFNNRVLGEGIYLLVASILAFVSPLSPYVVLFVELIMVSTLQFVCPFILWVVVIVLTSIHVTNTTLLTVLLIIECIALVLMIGYILGKNAAKIVKKNKDQIVGWTVTFSKASVFLLVVSIGLGIWVCVVAKTYKFSDLAHDTATSPMANTILFYIWIVSKALNIFNNLLIRLFRFLQKRALTKLVDAIIMQFIIVELVALLFGFAGRLLFLKRYLDYSIEFAGLSASTVDSRVKKFKKTSPVEGEEVLFLIDLLTLDYINSEKKVEHLIEIL